MIVIYLRGGYIAESHINGNFILKIKRKWVVDILSGYGLLKVLVYCYGFLYELVNNLTMKLIAK